MQRSSENSAIALGSRSNGGSSHDRQDTLSSFNFDAFLNEPNTSNGSSYAVRQGEAFITHPAQAEGPQHPPLQSSAGQSFLPNLTVSDDQSELEKIEERNLLALRDRVGHGGTEVTNDAGLPQFGQQPIPQAHQASSVRPKRRIRAQPTFSPPPPGSDPDYKLQLQLLEQQNKKRLLMARQEQDSTEGILPIHREKDVPLVDPKAIRRSLRQDPMMPAHTLSMEFQGGPGVVNRNWRLEKSGEPTSGPSNHALQDYQMQMMLLEQQNKKRLLMARQEQQTTATAGTRDSRGVEEPSGLTQDINNMDVDELGNYIERLQKRAKHLGAGGMRYQSTPRHHTFYRIQSSVHMEPDPSCTLYFDPPEVITGQNGMRSLRSNIPLENFDLFLEQNKDVVFLVFKTYVLPQNFNKRDAPPQIMEAVRPLASQLKDALEKELRSQDDYADILQSYRSSHELQAPYIFLYHNRRALGDMESSGEEQLSLFSRYITETCGSEYAIADALIADGLITPDYVKYLFKPGDVVIHHHSGKHEGWMARSWPQAEGEERLTRAEADSKKQGDRSMPYRSAKASADIANDTVSLHSWYLQTWHWEFDGNFQRQSNTLRFSIQTDIVEESAKGAPSKETATLEDKIRQVKKKAITIQSLAIQPLRYSEPAITETLKRRGKMYWKCRERRFVSYQENDTDNSQSAIHERYVIDMKTYRSLHKLSSIMTGLRDELGPVALAKYQPPDEVFALLMPLNIKGYNLRRKKWYDLEVDRISDVVWNKEAFSKVVIDRKAKDLIRALVEKQLAADVATDLIPGKGNGLILLLHGSPGTGKTLTAESVAEICQKPLYRVTCGDVGTKAEDVEKYLESVFYLGKLWDCVVLLDEADVFLEQRSLEDLQRNALVSVFLRMLEYYEGILILTSNRVGTFDEAFKSRIQLALHYPVLGPLQRLRIWENLIDRLESFKDDTIDIVDLRDHLDVLKNEKMNGRQIRNAITTARQYSQWKGKKLTYEELRDVIDVAGRFDRYLDNLHGNFGHNRLGEDERTSVGFVNVADTESSSSTI